MVLTDDNFATIVKAVENGRNLYQNIKRAIQFLLSGNFGAILTNLEQIERNVSEACIDIDANIAKIVGSIVTA